MIRPGSLSRGRAAVPTVPSVPSVPTVPSVASLWSFRSFRLAAPIASLVLGLVCAGVVSVETEARAQTAPPPSPAGVPAPALPSAAAPGSPAAPGAPTAPLTPPAPGAPVVPGPSPASAELSATPAGALTADLVGRRAADTSYSAKAAEEAVRSAAARVDQAWAAFLPRLSTKASYTRLSAFTPPSFGGGGSFVGTPANPGERVDPNALVAVGFSFPLILNQWALEAQMVVPISDYFLRINQAYSAATLSKEAARLDVVTARAKAGTDGKLAYYNWLRARGAGIVAKQALEAAKTHREDAKNQLAAGNASRADVLRAETAVAGAELTVERTKNLRDLTQKQVAIAIHGKEDEDLAPGDGIEGEPPPFVGSLPQLVAEAKSNRYEIRSIDVNAAVAKKQAAALRGAAYPNLSAFGSAVYANPNPRRVPQADEWFGTWALGAQVTWSPNDTYTALAGTREIEARLANVEQQRNAVRDGIELEVTQSFQGVREADFAIDSSKRQLASAEEAYRVARELFVNGRATSTTLTDAETDLTRARLEQLNARIEARTARIRLEHALGRDARTFDR